MKKRYTFNLLWIPEAIFMLWLGFTGRVDWWIILLVTVGQIEVNVTFRK